MKAKYNSKEVIFRLDVFLRIVEDSMVCFQTSLILSYSLLF